MARTAWSIALHGGAGARPERQDAGEIEGVRATLREALETGVEILEKAGASLDAVQAAVRVMERSGRLNAGRGAVLNRDGRVESDAAIMDGRERRAGAVAAVRRVANPIDLARAVLDDGRHVLIVGEGAERFAQDRGVELTSESELVASRRPRALEGQSGTVGAVALDVHGNLAAATSTGGLTGKLPGRVGDSPIPGAGTLAENGVCAVSATGAGEYFIRFAAASEVCARIKYRRESVEAASRAVIEEIAAAGGLGGLIAVDADGVIAMPFSAPMMLRASARQAQGAQVFVGI